MRDSTSLAEKSLNRSNPHSFQQISSQFSESVRSLVELFFLKKISPINHFLSHVVGIDLFPRDIYNFPSIPAFLTLRDLLTIGVSALAICTLAGLLPALRAARLEPVEALRYE